MIGKRNEKCMICIVLLGLSAITLTTAAGASILDRVTKVEDPELAACIRVAMQNLPFPEEIKRGYSSGHEKYRKAKQAIDQQRLEVVRAITESYAQIKLLDSQVAQIERRLQAIDGSAAPDALKHELFLAKAELESKRVQEFAKLRETMGIIPRHAFGQIQIEQLVTWVTLEVLAEDTILIFHKKRPFRESEFSRTYSFHKTGTNQQALNAMKTIMNDPSKLPFRLEISHALESSGAAKQLHERFLEHTRNRAIETDMDIRLSVQNRYVRKSVSFVIHGKVGEGQYSQRTQGEGGQRSILYGAHRVLDEAALRDEALTKLFGMRTYLPLSWTLKYDEESLALAQVTAEKIRNIATENGVQEFVEVKLEPTEKEWLPLEKWNLR